LTVGDFEARPSEADQVAAVLAWVRRQGPEDLLLEESLEIGGDRRRTDIGVHRAGRLIGIIEVKRPDKFRTDLLRNRAREQVERYARERNAEWVAWTDGITGFVRDCVTEAIARYRIIQQGGGLFSRRDVAKTPFKLGLTDEQIYSFPTQQRLLTPQPLPAELYVPRSVAGLSLEAFLGSRNDLLVISGEADVGKTILAYALAADPAWNALFIDGGSVTTDITSQLGRDVLELYGVDVPVNGLLETVAAESLNEFAVPLGVVIDGFEEFFAAKGPAAASDLASFIRLMRRLQCKVIVMARPYVLSTFRSFKPLANLLGETNPIDLEVLDDVEFSQFSARYLEARKIGGQLVDNAKEVCRLPGMLDLATEVYAGKDGIDPKLTEPKLYSKYRAEKSDRIWNRAQIPTEKVEAALYCAARLMRDADQFALPYLVVESEVGADVLKQLSYEGVFVIAGRAGSENYLRFRYGGFRDFLLIDNTQPSEEFVQGLITLGTGSTSRR